ncbi:hypothetical protein K2173_028376 [Erythroxylum novogranatense]|uniref:Retrovirus-related Pol polyprotein from transposon TNT 1-94-like beta-barrel domain-containing protein n=1 Tax=Erythroxylum novogranatense TaxID=1862640 RepID=A0AAV8U4P7_9ROSI|nr:hypothetical protein K2173_028376 [Erythroxylum novogranatense]
MKANGEDKGDAVVVEKILRPMTSKFDYVVCSIEESKDTSTLSIDELQSSLLVHEQRMSHQVEEEHALKITHGDQSRERGRGRGRGGPNYVEIKEEMLLMVFEEIKIGDQTDTWFLDSGCSNHMCGNKEYFFDLNKSFRESVKLANNSSLFVAGKGNVRLQINGMTQIITGVFYVPELKNNLLSIGQLQEKGLAILFQGDKCKVYHPERGLIMTTTITANRMFILHVRSRLYSNQVFQHHN